VDLDHFKQINDTYGHIMGDTVLATVAGIVRKTIRATDISGRYGGEELCIVLTETKIDGAYLVAKRLRRRIAAERFPAVNSGMFRVTCSIGLAQYHDDIQDFVAFVELADRALYQAKTLGRDRVVRPPFAP
jgi:diguanylate cyclase (GGDEF)-like protein